jgi:hypothetical protein
MLPHEKVSRNTISVKNILDKANGADLDRSVHLPVPASLTMEAITQGCRNVKR